MTNSSNIREVDLHDHRLFEAEITICEELEEAWHNDEEGVLLIHGYHNGTAIKSFIRRQEGLRNKLKRNYPNLPVVELEEQDAGSTYVVFKED